MLGDRASEGELDCLIVISPRHIEIKEAYLYVYTIG